LEGEKLNGCSHWKGKNQINRGESGIWKSGKVYDRYSKKEVKKGTRKGSAGAIPNLGVTELLRLGEGRRGVVQGETTSSSERPDETKKGTDLKRRYSRQTPLGEIQNNLRGGREDSPLGSKLLSSTESSKKEHDTLRGTLSGSKRTVLKGGGSTF